MKVWIYSLWKSVRNRKKISILKICAEACGLIFLLWEITCKKNTSLSSTKQVSRVARAARIVMLLGIVMLLEIGL